MLLKKKPGFLNFFPSFKKKKNRPVFVPRFISTFPGFYSTDLGTQIKINKIKICLYYFVFIKFF